MTLPAWGLGDRISILVGLAVLALVLWRRPHRRTAAAVPGVLANGMSLGPLLLIILDPLTQQFGAGRSLLQIAIEEGRTTLWWGAVVASVYSVRELA